MDSENNNNISSLFPEPRKLNQHVRYIERSSAELNIGEYFISFKNHGYFEIFELLFVSLLDLDVIRDVELFERSYELGEQIGKGGFGKVNEAIQVKTGKSVVIKQVDSDRVPCWCRVSISVFIPFACRN